MTNPYPPGSEAHRKTEINHKLQARYDELMRIGKHGHYETMFHVFHEMAPMLIAQGMREAAEIMACTYDEWNTGRLAILARAQEIDPQ